MRRIISTVIAATMLLSSCELIDFDKEDEGSGSGSTTVTIPTQYTQVDIAPESTKQEVTFTATESWEISLEETKATPTWITVSPMSGDAGYITLAITLESNTETEDRSTVITITSGGDEYEIVVTQQAAEVSYEDLDDRAILMELYEATDGDNWSNNTNWGSELPIDDWYGVTVEEDVVTRLDLEKNGLNGAIPESIGYLENLYILYLHENALSGNIPETIGNLVNLTQLSLYSNNFTDSVPESLGNLTNMKWFYLFNNDLSGIVPPSVVDLKDNCINYVINPQNDGSKLFVGIYTTEEFLEFADQVNSGYLSRENRILMTDIDLADIDFEPIGSGIDNDRGDGWIYYGIFDGNNHTIKNLTISRPSVWNVGLFGIVSPESEVYNLKLSNISISGGGATGAVAGRNYYGIIRDCIVEDGSVLANDECVGGIAGINTGTISRCENNSDVESSSGGFVGGVVGFNNEGDVVECSNSGSVYSYGSDNFGTTGYLGVGGIVGNNLDKSSIIACYNTGAVKGSECVGGIVGRNYAEVDICYNKGDVDATMIIAFVGGIIGSNKSGGIVTSCYNTGNAENINTTDSDVASKTSAGAVAGYNDGTFVACCYNSMTYALGGLSSVAGALDGASKGLDYSMMNDALSSDIPYRYTTSGAIEYTE